jgi:hypothetical protein
MPKLPKSARDANADLFQKVEKLIRSGFKTAARLSVSRQRERTPGTC